MGRSYTQQTIKLLFGQARACAFPECSIPLVLHDRNQRTVVAEIAHIRSERPDGPRHDPTFLGDVNGPENLLLLCGVHHKPVDRHESIYPIDELERWKAAQSASADGGTVVSDEEVMAIVRITNEERKAVDQIIRVAYRAERAAREGRTAVADIEVEYEIARQELQKWVRPVVLLDDDGNETTTMPRLRMPSGQQDEFARQAQSTVQVWRPRIQELVANLGEEVAVLHAMDPLLGQLATDVVAAAEHLPELFNDPARLDGAVERLQAQVRGLVESARARY